MTDDRNETAPGSLLPDSHDVEDPDTSPDIDSHAWRDTLFVTLAFGAFSALWVVAIAQLSLVILNGGEFDGSRWAGAADMWPPIRAANTMLAGSPLAPYTMNPNFVAMPGFAALHVPLSAIVLAFDIPALDYRVSGASGQDTGIGSSPFGSIRPEMIALYTTWAVLWSIVFSKAVRTLAWELGVRTRLALLQVVTIALGYFPMVLIYGHLEDGLMVTLVLFAIVQCKRRNWTNVAICLTFALSLKQTTALVVPMFFFFVPREDRLRFVVITVSLPVLLVVGAFVTDFDSAFRSLVRPPTNPVNPFSRQAWFLASDESAINAGPYRLGAPVLALAFALWLRRNRDVALLTAGVGMAFFARLPAEAVSYMYYLSPVLVVAAIYETRRNGNALFATVFGTASLALYWWEASKAWWFWPIEAALLAAATWPLWVDVARRRLGGDSDCDDGAAASGPAITTSHVTTG